MKSTHPTLVCCHLNTVSSSHTELRLLYTYSHLCTPLQDILLTHTDGWLKSRLHHQWVRSQQFRGYRLSLRRNTQIKHRRVTIATSSGVSNQHLIITTASYSINSLTLRTVGEASNTPGFVSYFNSQIIRFYLTNINYLYMEMVRAHFFYSLFFVSRNYNSITQFSLALPKLSRSEKAQTPFCSVFHNMKHL